MEVRFYTRADCTLCENVLGWLDELKEEIPFQLLTIDIDKAPGLTKRYGEHTPVIEAGPYTLRAPFDVQDLKVTLLAAKDSQPVRPTPLPSQTGVWSKRLNRGMLTFTKNWVFFFNLIVLVYVGLPFTAPALMKAGATNPARIIYKVYSPLCHQLAFRSWFLFGEQAAYPRSLAGTDLMTFQESTGLSDDDLWTARDYIGNEVVGYKVALCQRDIAIYIGILVAGMIYGLFRKHIKALPLSLWMLLGVLPIALDGGSQLLAAFPFLPLPARESTPLLRTLTGLMFGIMNVWMAYPYIEETMVETHAAISTKLAVVAQREMKAGTDG
jgi:uncharacterized membrane protein